ncbi:Transducin/WD40 repeat-like superfamily protein [Zea mays]|nr:Transducin/WD40 repeat-like superfamily protein [Zea mays]
MTVAYLKEKPAGQGSTPSTPSAGSGMRSAAARLLGTGNGSRALSFGSNGTSRAVSGSSRMGGGIGVSTSASGSQGMANYDGKGAYIIFNTADTLFISDLNSHDKDPIKSIHFSSSNPLCHAFDPEAKDGHDLLVGVFSGDVYSMSLRQQLQDPGKKPVSYQHFVNRDKDKDKDPSQGGAASSRSTCVAWVPEREGIFVVSHADGNLYVYDKCKDGNTDWTFPTVKDQSQVLISHAKSSKSNPIARWHICQGAINDISFSPDGAYLATVGRDGHLRVFDFAKEQLIFGGKSYYGALLCCSWSADGKYLLSGGEDDLVQVWSMDDRKIVAWGEGHNSWVTLSLQLSLLLSHSIFN